MSIWNVLLVTEIICSNPVDITTLNLLFLTSLVHTWMYHIDFKDSILLAAGQEQFNSIIN